MAHYLSHADAKSAAAARDIKAAHPQATVGAAFNVAYGGLSVRLPANQAKSLLSLPGVVAVQLDAVDHPSATSGSASTALLDDGQRHDLVRRCGQGLAEPGWSGQGGCRGDRLTDLDTGIWPEHPMLQDLGIPRPRPVSKKFGCEFGKGSDPDLGPSFKCNDKLVGAYAFLDTALSLGVVEQGEYCDVDAATCSARDSDGHGTHTSTTAAGDGVATRRAAGARSGARQRPGSGSLRDRVPRLCARGAATPVRLRRGGAAGNPRRGRRHQLLDRRRRESLTAIRWSSPSSMPTRPASASALRQAMMVRTPAPQDMRARGSSPSGRVTPDPRVHQYPPSWAIDGWRDLHQERCHHHHRRDVQARRTSQRRCPVTPAPRTASHRLLPVR